MPIGHSVHPVMLVAPVSLALPFVVIAAPDPYVPGGQSAGLQETAPASSWYDLKGHATQPCARDLEPLALPFLPSGHSVQAASRLVRPVPALPYLPMGHMLQSSSDSKPVTLL